MKTRQKLIDLRMSTMMDTIEDVTLQNGKKIKFAQFDNIEAKTFNDKSAFNLCEMLEFDKQDLVFQLDGKFLFSH